MLPRRSARGGLSMTRITRRKTPDDIESIGVPAVRCGTGAEGPGAKSWGEQEARTALAFPDPGTGIVTMDVCSFVPTRTFSRSVRLTNFAW